MLGLPRGGVPVAARVAEALGAPLDVVVVRKLALPDQPELALGAVGEGGVRLVDDAALVARSLPRDALAAVEQHERAAVAARVDQLRSGRPLPHLAGPDRGGRRRRRRHRRHGPGRVPGRPRPRGGPRRARRSAAPVGLAERVPEADDVVTLVSPRPFGAVSQHYADFSPTPEALVLAELASHVRVGPAVPLSQVARAACCAAAQAAMSPRAQRDGEQVGERVRRAGEGGHAERLQRGGVLVVVRGRAGVAEREQHDDRHARRDQRGDAAQQLLGVAALEEVGDEHEQRVLRLPDEAGGVRDAAVDVRAAAELAAEQHVDGVVEVRRQVDDLGVEDDQRGPQRPDRGEHRAEDRARTRPTRPSTPTGRWPRPRRATRPARRGRSRPAARAPPCGARAGSA